VCDAPTGAIPNQTPQPWRGNTVRFISLCAGEGIARDGVSSVPGCLELLSYWVRRDFGTATITVTLRGASGLRNADLTGKSDPYVKLSLGRHHWRSSTIPCCLDPIWEETHQVAGSVRDLLFRPLLLDLFDDDSIAGLGG
jgi:hypothetical protein